MKSSHIQFDVSLKSLNAHIYSICCTIKDIHQEEIHFSLPSWTPGSYLIRDFAQHVLSIRAFDGLQNTPLLKISKDTWSCRPRGSELRIEYEIYAFDTSIRAAFLDDSYAFFSGTSVFMRIHDFQHLPHLVTIKKPEFEACESFRVATSMEPSDIDDRRFGAYRCKDYDELVDHPILISDYISNSFIIDGISHHLIITPRLEFDMQRLINDCRHICEKHIQMFGAPAPFKHYYFLLRVEEDGYGGLEHRASSALLCKIDDLPVKGQMKISDGYRSLLGLISHEYFHAWNVKQLKPSAFVPYDYSRENYTELLWFFEGFTSYYDDLLLLRSQVIDMESYLELLSRTISRVQGSQGRLRQSLADASFDAWIKFYKPNENSPNATVSYYLKGSLVALALDMMIRLKSHHQSSLDDVMKGLWKKFGIQASGLNEASIIEEANLATGEDLQPFFNSYIHSTVDLPLPELFAHFGIELKWQEKTKEKNAADSAPYLGCHIKQRSDECKILHIDEDSPAMLAGLCAGDILLAINDFRTQAATFDSQLAKFQPGDKIKIHLFRRGRLRNFNVLLANDPKTTCVLKKYDQPTAEQKTALQAWLGIAPV